MPNKKLSDGYANPDGLRETLSRFCLLLLLFLLLLQTPDQMKRKASRSTLKLLPFTLAFLMLSRCGSLCVWGASPYKFNFLVTLPVHSYLSRYWNSREKRPGLSVARLAEPAPRIYSSRHANTGNGMSQEYRRGGGRGRGTGRRGEKTARP